MSWSPTRSRFPSGLPKTASYGQLVVTQKSYATAHPDVVKKFAAAVQQATAYMDTHLKDSNDQTVLKAAQKSLEGVPDGVVQASLQQVDWPASGSMSAMRLEEDRGLPRQPGNASRGRRGHHRQLDEQVPAVRRPGVPHRRN